MSDERLPAADPRTQAIYTPATLAFYDAFVLGLSNRLIWRCPTRRILALYDRHATDNHLDVGVGTGWYLDHCGFRAARPRIGLMDANPHSLAAASRRIARYRPETFRADVLAPVGITAARFGSISLTYLLHCLPGGMDAKARAFDNLRPMMAPGAVVFGATLLARGVPRNAAARALMRAYNRMGVFSNATDGLDDLRAALQSRFTGLEIETIGCAALFSAVA